ncbi:hypothetical protein EMN47_10305 [Prolixibacteraceae bacterium JC049]|nr:hypothetical protein [Prolixibacteraceae bacterium JC049]
MLVNLEFTVILQVLKIQVMSNSNTIKIDGMKNFIYIILVFLICFIACEDANEKHEKYLEIGSPVFAGKVDSLDTYPGFYRTKILFYPSVDVNKKEARIYWDNFKDSVVVPYVEEYQSDKPGWYEVTVGEAQGFASNNFEGYRTFFIKNYDVKGNHSKTGELIVQIYGNDFAEALSNQAFSGFDGQNINLGAKEYVSGAVIEYTANDNTTITKYFTEPVTSLKLIGTDLDLPNFKSGTILRYKSVYKFNDTDLDEVTVGHWSTSSIIILPPQLVIKQTNIVDCDASASEHSVTVKVWEGEDWEASCSADWVSLEKNESTGRLNVSLYENNTGVRRTAEIQVNVVGKSGEDFVKTVSVDQGTSVIYGKTNWVELELADNSGSDYGWTPAHLWNNSAGGTGYHSANSDRAPYLVSINLGAPVSMEYFRIYPRSAHGRAAVRWEVWASNTANEVGVANNAENWEAKAIETGWVKIASCYDDNHASFNPVSARITDQTPYQYIRYRVLENSKQNSAYNLMEVDVMVLP